MEKSVNSAVANQQENCFLVDWLSVTFFDMSVSGVQQLLGLAGNDIPWQVRTTFTNGYPRTTFWNCIFIRWGADNVAFYTDDPEKSAADKVRTDMGISLTLSGQGCRAFEEYGAKDWIVLLTKIIQECGRVNVTRLDLAYDDHVGLLDIHVIEELARDRCLTCKARKVRGIWSDDWDEDLQGLTIEVGSRRSDVLIRFYDKAAERGFDHSRHWIRCEIELHQERANCAVTEILKQEHVGRTASGILRNYCMFRVSSPDSNKSRWPVCLWWEYCLECMERIRLVIAPGEPYNYHKTVEHMKLQYGQAFVTYFMIYGETKSFLDACLESNPVLKPKYQAEIESARAEQVLRQKKYLDAQAALKKRLEHSRKIYGFDVIPEDHILSQVDVFDIFGPDLDSQSPVYPGDENLKKGEST